MTLPIEQLYQSGAITSMQYQAGMAWRQDYLDSSTTQGRGRMMVKARSSGGQPSVMRDAARDRYRRGRDRMGSEVAPLCLDTVCRDVELAQAASEHGMRMDKARTVIDLGMQSLVSSYDVSNAE